MTDDGDRLDFGWGNVHLGDTSAEVLGDGELAVRLGLGVEARGEEADPEKGGEEEETGAHLLSTVSGQSVHRSGGKE
jgi:hypothetical protein